MRRVARWNELPEDSRPLIDRFVENRLLIKDWRDNEDVVEVALESLLWQWDDLATWLNDAWRELKEIAELERATAAWEHNDRHSEWLLSGDRLIKAEALAETASYRERLAVVQEFLDTSRQTELREAISAKLVSSSHEMLEDNRSGTETRALQQLLAARMLVTPFDDYLLHVAGVKTSTHGKIIQAHKCEIHCLAFSPDGRHIISGGPDATMRIWDVHTGRPVGPPIVGNRRAVWTVAFSPDGDRIASGDADGKVRLWNAHTGEPVGTPIDAHDRHTVHCVVFSPDGRRIASAGDDKGLRLWDADTGRALHRALKGHSDAVFSIAFSPDGQQLVTGGRDKELRIWNVETGKCVGKPLAGHTDVIHAVAFSGDGRRIISGGSDGTVRHWNLENRHPIGDVKSGHDGAVIGVAFTTDDSDFVSASRDATIRIWRHLRSSSVRTDGAPSGNSQPGDEPKRGAHRLGKCRRHNTTLGSRDHTSFRRVC